MSRQFPREGWFWAKLVHPTNMPPTEDWASTYWEAVEIIDNNGEGDEAFAVAFPGIGPWQWPQHCIFGPEIFKPVTLK